MKPIRIEIHGVSPHTPQEMCAAFLDTERWPDFKGYSFLPGIQSARFETRAPGLVGSRIQVQNTDGSSHVEEILTWQENSGFSVKFQEFSAPLVHTAKYFVEEWTFRPAAEGTAVTRSMTMVPTGLAGWLVLSMVAPMMKKAFEVNAHEQGTRLTQRA